ncbi:SDR family NAD(P)-dependent oxidoreductase [Streptomyces sp. CAI-85]|uniref:SDR family NAD(P)-dependent oxidoreductase n=1 Tax=Streptomyces sp. CAI-85 TaxID=1472662 RepID=UPI0020CA42E5|nr:SDR family NAD(P)-dependent oxidoreductase [Streptomyces sp. CAI-85]
MPRYDLAGRTVLITGSTGGLGTALARALRDRGARLALLDLDGDLAQRQATDLGPETTARGWAADVRDLAGLRSATDAAAAHFGRLDVVVAGAGVGSMAPLETLDPEAWERVVDINLSGVWRTFRAALPHVKRHRGYLLAVSSMAAFVHSPLNGPYVASKAGVWALCDATRLELRHEGVGVGSAHPTFFKTPMLDDVHADPAGAALGRQRERFVEDGSPRQGCGRRRDRIRAPVPHDRRPAPPGPGRPNSGARAPACRPVGFRGTTIPDAIARSTPAGWISRAR